jgi:hypothetical protein
MERPAAQRSAALTDRRANRVRTPRDDAIGPPIDLRHELAMAFGALALVLAAVGVYGVLSLVRGRTHARDWGSGWRSARRREDWSRSSSSTHTYLTTTGVVAGVALALALSPLVRSPLYGVGGSDPATIAPSPPYCWIEVALAAGEMNRRHAPTTRGACASVLAPGKEARQ